MILFRYKRQSDWYLQSQALGHRRIENQHWSCWRERYFCWGALSWRRNQRCYLWSYSFKHQEIRAFVCERYSWISQTWRAAGHSQGRPFCYLWQSKIDASMIPSDVMLTLLYQVWRYIFNKSVICKNRTLTPPFQFKKNLKIIITWMSLNNFLRNNKSLKANNQTLKENNRIRWNKMSQKKWSTERL